MLASIALTLKPSESSSNVPTASGQHVRAAFYDLVRDTDEALAGRLHDDSGPAAFSLSPISGRISWRTRQPSHAGSPCSLRICTLTDPLFQAVATSLARKVTASEGIRIGQALFTLENYDFLGPNGAPGLSTYEQLLASEPLAEFRFVFRTPTAFKQGRTSMPLPIPRLMFQSYLSRWNGFAPPECAIDEDLPEVVERSVMIKNHDIASRLLDMKNMKMVGFIGSCTLGVDSGLSELQIRQITALAHFAQFAGTGAKTTVGMGQTLVNSER